MISSIMIPLGGVWDAVEESMWLAIVFFIIPHLCMTWYKRKGRERLRAADEAVKTSSPVASHSCDMKLQVLDSQMIESAVEIQHKSGKLSETVILKKMVQKKGKTLSEASTCGDDSDTASTGGSDTLSECPASVCSTIDIRELPSTTPTKRRCKMTDQAQWEKEREVRSSEKWEKNLIREVKRKDAQKKWLAAGDAEDTTNANVQTFLNPRTQLQKNDRTRIEVAKQVYNMLLTSNTDVSYRTYVLLIEIAILHKDLGLATQWADEMEKKYNAQLPQKVMDKMTNLFINAGPSEKAEKAEGMLNPISPEQDQLIKALSAHPWFCKSKHEAKVLQNQVIGCEDGTLICLSMHSPNELEQNEVQWPPPCRWENASDFSIRRLKLICGPGAPGCVLQWGETKEDIICDFETADIESGQLVWKKVSTGLTWQWNADPRDLR